MHMDRLKMNTNSNLLSSISNIPLDVDILRVVDVRTMGHDIAYGINVVRHKY